MDEEIIVEEVKEFDLTKVSIQSAFDVLDAKIQTALDVVNAVLAEGRVVTSVEEIGAIQSVLSQAAGEAQAWINEKSKVVGFFSEELPEAPKKE